MVPPNTARDHDAMPKDTQETTPKRTTPPQGGGNIIVKSSKHRLSTALRKAINAIAKEGTTKREAARRAGMNETSLGKALAKPHVAKELEAAKTLFALEMNDLRGTAKAIAIQTGIELMRTSASDNVRARMVEFFAGEGRQPLVNVSVSAGQDRGVYAYTKPRDITPPDSTSGVTAAQAIEIEGKASEVLQQPRAQGPDWPDGA
jgi:lambda repressor-like predicted transcriptional regulator